MLNKILLSVMLIAISIHANIENVIKNTNDELVVEVSTEYVLGDQDTRISAKAIAIQNAKVLASEYAGTYVESELVLNNDTIIKDKIATITMAFLSTEILSQEYAITQDGRTKLAIKLQATLDKNVFNKKLEAIRIDERKAQELTQLKKDNERLNAELAELSKAILSIQSIKESNEMSVNSKNSAIYEQRDRVLKSLSSNQKKVISIIDGQSLKEQVIQARETKQLEEQRLVADIENDLYNNLILPIQNNTKYSISKKPIIVNGKATTQVKWTMDPIVPKTLKKYFGSRIMTNGYKDLNSEYIEMPGAVIVSKHPTTSDQMLKRPFDKVENIAFNYLMDHLAVGRHGEGHFVLSIRKEFKTGYAEKMIIESSMKNISPVRFGMKNYTIEEFLLDHCIESIPDAETDEVNMNFEKKYIYLTSGLGKNRFAIQLDGVVNIYYNDDEIEWLTSIAAEVKAKQKQVTKDIKHLSSMPTHNNSEKEAIKECLKSRHQKTKRLLGGLIDIREPNYEMVERYLKSREAIESKLNTLLPVPKEWREQE